MARLFTSGFELNSTTANVEWTTLNSTPSIVTSPVRSGTYALQITSPSSGVKKGLGYTFASAAAAGPYYYRAYVRVAAYPDVQNGIMSLTNAANGTTQLRLEMKTDGKLVLYNANTGLQIGTDTSALSLDTWYRIELVFDNTGGAGAAVAKLYIDGTEIITSSTQTFNNVLACHVGMNIQGEAATSGTVYFDDVALNDNTGSAQTSLPGAGSVVVLMPNAAGDNSMGARGGTDTGTDYGQVNAIPPSDASYYVLDVDNDIIDFNVDSSSTPGISASDTVSLVHVGYRVRDAASSGASASNARIKSASGGTVSSGTALGDLGTTFNTNNTAAPRNYRLTSYTDPSTAAAWTPTGTNSLDNMQIGYIATDAAPDVWISALWAMVEYVPSSGASASVSDAVTVSESITVALVSNPSVFDAVAVAENIGIILVNLSSVSDSVSVQEDVVVFLPILTAEVSDSLAISEYVEAVVTSFADVSDQVAISENVGTGVTSSLSVSEDVSIADVAAVDTTSLVNVTDDVSIVDATVEAVISLISVGEDVSISEDVSIIVTDGSASVSVSDSISIADVVTIDITSFVSAGDDVSISESLTILAVSFVSVGDDLSVAEDASLALTSLTSVVDNVSVADVPSVTHVFDASVGDDVLISDVVTPCIVSLVSVSDDVAIQDSSTALSISNIEVFDSVTIEDSPTVFITNYTPEVSDSTSITENVGVLLLNLVISVNDAVSVAEDVATIVQNLLIDVSEGVIISESVSVLIPTLPISVFDTVSIAEGVTTFESVPNISINDSVTISESVTVAVGYSKVAVLTDDFNDNSINSAKWTTYTNLATVSETNNHIEIAVTPSTSGSEGDLISQNPYDLTESSASVSISQVVVAGADTVMFLEENGTSGDRLMWDVNGSDGNAYATYELAYVAQNTGTVTTPTIGSNTYFRIRETGGNVYWDYSTDGGGSWTNTLTLATASLALDITKLDVVLQAYEYSASGAGTQATTIFDNFNVYPVGSSSLYDSVSISESVTTEVTSFISESDSISITEQSVPTIVSLVSVSDSVTVSESITAGSFLLISVSDSTTLSESVTILTTITQSIFDSVTASESISPSVFQETISLSISDSVTIAESVSASRGYSISVYEAVSISESTSFTIGVATSVFDAIGITDIPSPFLILPISVYDSVILTESVNTESIRFSPEAPKFRPVGKVPRGNAFSVGGTYS